MQYQHDVDNCLSYCIFTGFVSGKRGPHVMAKPPLDGGKPCTAGPQGFFRRQRYDVPAEYVSLKEKIF